MAHRLDDGREVRGRRATAAAHDVDAVFGDELRQVFGQCVGGQVVVHLAVDDTGQAALGMHDSAMGAVSDSVRRGSYISTGPVAQLSPTRRRRGAQRGDGRTDLGAGQHAPGQFDGDLGLDRYDAPWRTMARWHAAMAALPERRSNIVSTIKRSTPPSRSP